MSRIPNFDGDNEVAYVQDVNQFVVQEGAKYEKDFSRFLMDYVKEDEILKNFYIRFIYECEIVKIVSKNRTKIHLMELDMIVSNMENAPNTETLAIYDSSFHQKLFSIAEKEDFLFGLDYSLKTWATSFRDFGMLLAIKQIITGN